MSQIDRPHPSGANASLVIAHQFGAAATELLRARLPNTQIIEFEPGPITECPREYTVLLSGPSLMWRGGATQAPAGWPGSLRFIQLPAAGVDGYPTWFLAATEVTTGLGVNAIPVSEYVLATMLTHEKHIPALWVHERAAWRRSTLGTLAGRTLGVAGVGHIGRAVAKRARAFEMQVLGHRRRIDAGPPPEFDALVPLAELFERADHIVLALPATRATRGMVDAAMLARCKPTAHLVNVARGSLIDAGALLAALDAGRLAAATLDVTEPEPPVDGDRLYTHPRIRLSPHLATSSPQTLARLIERFVANLERRRTGAPLIEPLPADWRLERGIT